MDALRQQAGFWCSEQLRARILRRSRRNELNIPRPTEIGSRPPIARGELSQFADRLPKLRPKKNQVHSHRSLWGSLKFRHRSTTEFAVVSFYLEQTPTRKAGYEKQFIRAIVFLVARAWFSGPRAKIRPPIRPQPEVQHPFPDSSISSPNSSQYSSQRYSATGRTGQQGVRASKLMGAQVKKLLRRIIGNDQ